MTCFQRLWTWLPSPQSILSTRTGGGKCRLENVTTGKIWMICGGLRNGNMVKNQIRQSLGVCVWIDFLMKK